MPSTATPQSSPAVRAVSEADGGEPWIIVPAYNEARRLESALAGLCRLYRRVVVVDDGSEDGTSDVATHWPVYRLRHLINRGQGAALKTGLEFALAEGAQILVTFDADGQHDVNDIAALVAPICRGEADVVLGSRFLGEASVGMPASRRVVLKTGVLFTRLFSRLKVSDTHNGLRAFSREAAEQLPFSEDGMAHASEILDEIHRRRLRYCEVPVKVRYSSGTLEKGQSSLNAVKIAGKFLLGRILR